MASEEDLSALFTFKGGDLNLIANYKGKRMVGSVASPVMVLASPVWEKIIFPPWFPSKTQDDQEPFDETSNQPALVKIQDEDSATVDVKQIDCSQDDGEALLVLLRIAHLQFGAFLEMVTLATLFSLAILCEEYECHRLISPWSATWINYQ